MKICWKDNAHLKRLMSELLPRSRWGNINLLEPSLPSACYRHLTLFYAFGINLILPFHGEAFYLCVSYLPVYIAVSSRASVLTSFPGS